MGQNYMLRVTFYFLPVAIFFFSIPMTSRAFADDSFQCLRPLPENEQKGIVGAVEKKYSEMIDLQAHFFQESYFLGSDQRKMSQGLVAFKRPGMMDWNYDAPDEQRFVSNGQIVWWYQPKEKQVTLRTLQESFSSDVPVSFLLGVGKLQENFRLHSACYSAQGVVLKLLPLKPNASLEEFYLLVDSKTHSPSGARILDIGGNETQITFQSQKLNTNLSTKQFEFEIPKGTDIIDERSEEAGRQVGS